MCIVDIMIVQSFISGRPPVCVHALRQVHWPLHCIAALLVNLLF